MASRGSVSIGEIAVCEFLGAADIPFQEKSVGDF
jgi:hypothetical protein